MAGGIFSSFGVSASGLSAQRRRLDVIAENLANVETTRTPEGGPYRRKRAVMQSEPARTRIVRRGKSFIELMRSHFKHLKKAKFQQEAPVDVAPRVSAAVEQDERPFRLEYDPGHPDADEHGYVLKPNVSVVEEMVDMISATRAYQANAAALEAAKDMFNESLRI